MHGLLGEQLSDLQLQIEIFPRGNDNSNRRRIGRSAHSFRYTSISMFICCSDDDGVVVRVMLQSNVPGMANEVAHRCEHAHVRSLPANVLAQMSMHRLEHMPIHSWSSVFTIATILRSDGYWTSWFATTGPWRCQRLAFGVAIWSESL